jgi:hypothetical protein
MNETERHRLLEAVRVLHKALQTALNDVGTAEHQLETRPDAPDLHLPALAALLARESERFTKAIGQLEVLKEIETLDAQETARKLAKEG